MPRPTLVPLVLASVFLAVLAGCSGDDADGAAAPDESAENPPPAARFCDVYLDYLGEPTPDHLDAVVEATDDADVATLATVIADDDRTGRVLAATSDLDELARTRCQSEWTAGAQGAGSTDAAAQAFFDAVVAGDKFGARNVASANAIAVFEPWDPLEVDDEAGIPAVRVLDTRVFALVLREDRLAECQVETGVVVACSVVE